MYTMKLFKILSSVLIYFSNLNQIRGTGTVDVTYEELQELNISCYPYDTCSQTGIKPDCSCDRTCSRYGTCCVDSEYKHLPAPIVMPTCQDIGGIEILGIDQCPKTEDSQNIKEDLCMNVRNIKSDITRLVPVTSLLTNTTYKNFYCYRCHEAHDNVLFWDLKLSFSERLGYDENTVVHLEYDSHREEWVAQLGQQGAFVPVSLRYIEPNTITVKRCRKDVISNCSEYWNEDTIKAKCDAYKAEISIDAKDYKNPHCAICNFEDIKSFRCFNRVDYPGYDFTTDGSVDVLFTNEFDYDEGTDILDFRLRIFRSFSLINILDISPSGGQKIGHIQMCDHAASWDPHFKKCRIVKCIHPDYVVKDGKCAAA